MSFPAALFAAAGTVVHRRRAADEDARIATRRRREQSNADTPCRLDRPQTDPAWMEGEDDPRLKAALARIRADKARETRRLKAEADGRRMIGQAAADGRVRWTLIVAMLALAAVALFAAVRS